MRQPFNYRGSHGLIPYPQVFVMTVIYCSSPFILVPTTSVIQTLFPPLDDSNSYAAFGLGVSNIVLNGSFGDG